MEAGAKRLLAETGLNLQHEQMLREMAEAGWPVDLGRQRVFFPEDKLEAALAEFTPLDWENLPPFRVQVGVYTRLWLPPGADKPVPQTLDSVARLTRLGDWLPHSGYMIGMGVPSEIPEPVLPLWLYFLAWRYAERLPSDGGGLHSRETIPYLREMGEIMAAARGGKVRDWLKIAVELKSPLMLASHYADVYYEMSRLGFSAGLTSMPSIGGSAPVTLAGAISVQLAEMWACNLVHRQFYPGEHLTSWRGGYGGQNLEYVPSLSPLDMRTCLWRFGRPETALVFAALGQLAQCRQAFFQANCFVGEGHAPSEELAYQKALTVIPSLLAGSCGTGSSGLLSLDEFMSPLQMILDDEFCGALMRMADGFAVNEETLATDLINQIGPGGVFLNQPHTAKHFRQELWLPRLWTSTNYSGWLASGAKTELQQAEDIYHQVMAEYHPRPFGEETEQALLEVMRRAERDLVGHETEISLPE
jgi:trimethylamine--corrinoid protein Co-methyltransferase